MAASYLSIRDVAMQLLAVAASIAINVAYAISNIVAINLKACAMACGGGRRASGRRKAATAAHREGIGGGGDGSCLLPAMTSVACDGVTSK